MVNEASSTGQEIQPYKFGGKELDEMHGLQWYAQGARPFDAVIPRTPTMDPHAENYYSTSPYVQYGNNPVNNIDPDGKDYILTIDMENNRITISGTYYSSTQDLASAQQAVDYWNNQSGDFSYGDFTVDFSLSVVEVETDASMSTKEITGALYSAQQEDKSGGGNAYQVVTSKELKDANKNGTTQNGNFIMVKNTQSTADTGAHEVGHSLGLVHSSSGLMTPSSTDSHRSQNVRTGDVKDMITYPLKEKQNSENGNPAGKGTVMYLKSSFSTENLYPSINKKGKVRK
jgi:RHS repeat-associated protein